MKECVNSRSGTALVLPGGGARGAYQVGVLKAIAEMTGEGHGPFDVISGTSAGAINAAVMASHAHEFSVGTQRLEKFWGSMKCSRVYRTDAWSVLSSGMRLALTLLTAGLVGSPPPALLDNAPLRLFLDKTLQLQGIALAAQAGALKGVAVTASAYTRASAISFCQGADDLQGWERHRRCGVIENIEVSHLLASAALPVLFPAEKIGNEYYGDGGMRMVAPLSPAIHLGADRILVIATRDESPDEPRQAPVRYPSLGMIGGYLLDTIFMDRLNTDLARLKRINQTLKLIPEEQKKASGLRPIDSLVIRPSRDLREVTAEHVGSIPGAVKMLLRTLGGWGRDWRMASYLLFEAAYCSELIDLGYRDGNAQADEIKKFLSSGEPSV